MLTMAICLVVLQQCHSYATLQAADLVYSLWRYSTNTGIRGYIQFNVDGTVSSMNQGVLLA